VSDKDPDNYWATGCLTRELADDKWMLDDDIDSDTQ
jgi:hypothetical protein